MFIFIFFIICWSQPIIAMLTCDPNKKIFYGQSSRDEATCKKGGACYDSTFGCYYSQENIPGFRIHKGECTSCSASEVFSDLDRIECGRECLKRSDCQCFTYDISSGSCILKNVVCNSMNDQISNKLTYNKYASNKVLCFHADCHGHDITKVNKNVAECYEFCKTKGNCKSFALVTTPTANDICGLKSVLCDVTSRENTRLFINLCIPGPVFPDWLDNHYSNRNEISDDSNSTCKSVGLADNFNLKIPWPSVGNNSPDFTIKIIGKNFQRCVDFRTGLHGNCVLAFVVNEFLGSPRFTGNFRACQLIDGNNNTYCKYFCSCGLDFCEAVHIRGFGTDESNMSICHYQISQD